MRPSRARPFALGPSSRQAARALRRRRGRARPEARGRETVADHAARAARQPELAAELASSVGKRAARCARFASFGFGARALEPVAIGLSEGCEGTLPIGRSSSCCADLPAQGDLVRTIARDDAVARCVEQALDELFGSARRPLSRCLSWSAAPRAADRGFAAQRRRALAVQSRAAVERRMSLSFGAGNCARVSIARPARQRQRRNHRLQDRRRGERADWFRERLRDTQVPLYAVHAERTCRAVILGQLSGASPAMPDFWQQPVAFPGRPVALPDGRSWTEQLSTWRRQLQELIEEFAAGDVRVFANDESADARGEYAPLTRVLEQLALHRGTLQPW